MRFPASLLARGMNEKVKQGLVSFRLPICCAYSISIYISQDVARMPSGSF
jgi:hypothetical protein